MGTPLRVLLVEDSDDDATILLHELRRGGFDLDSHRVETETAMRAALDARTWDIIISDYKLPLLSGLEALAVRNACHRDVPFIIVSGTIGEDVAVAAMKSGAQDYLIKGRLSRLVPAVERELADARSRKSRERAEAELQMTRERLTAVLGATNDTIYDRDVVLDRVWFSEAMLKAYGYPEREVHPALLWWLDRLHSDDRRRNEESVRSALAGAATWSSEYRFRRRDGTWAHVLDRAHVVYDPKGTPVRWIGSMTDLSEYRKLEAQFHHSQKMESIGRLAGGIAHDFNNLLTAIEGYSELLLGQLNQTDHLREGLEEIRKAGRRAAQLTHQLLAFSRKQVLQPRILDLNEVVADMDKLLRRLIGEDIELVTRCEPNLGHVNADPGQLEQVIVNLCVNARDAMPKGGKLTIETTNVVLGAADSNEHAEVVPGPYILLTVADTGMGMDKDTLSHAFEPFFTTKEKGKGTGLGLSTVYGIVRQSGGHAWICSELGRGTTVRVYLPRVEDRSEAQRHTIAGGTPAPRGIETVLVVEDEDLVRELARTVLAMHGYHVIEAESGGHALIASERFAGKIDLLLTDVVLPRMSGRELADRLAPLRPEMRVLFTSGYTDDAIVHHGVLDPETEFIPKPFSPDALVRKVREVLDAPRP